MGNARDDQFKRLSPRMRECLRLAFNRKTNKQIAAALGVEEGTIKGYIADAVRILDARGKIDAAERLHEYERASQEAPSIVHPPIDGVAEIPSLAPIEASSAPPSWQALLPIRGLGASHNDLSVRERLAWIFFIAVGLAVGLGAVASTLRFLNDLVGRH